MTAARASRISRSSLSEQVANALAEFIAEQGMREGDRLAPAQELEEQFGVSRTVVREAIAILAARGLVRRSQGRETVVAIPGGDQLRDLIEFRVRHSQIDLLSVQELREALEVSSARLAASRRTTGQLEELRQRLDALEQAPNDSAFVEADIAFHRALAEAAGNPLISIVLDALAPLLHEGRKRTVAEWRAHDSTLEFAVESHKRIFDAVASENVELAGVAMVDDLAETRASLARSLGLAAYGDDPAPGAALVEPSDTQRQ